MTNYLPIARFNVFVVVLLLLNSMIKVQNNKFIKEYKILPANCYNYFAGKSMFSRISDGTLQFPAEIVLWVARIMPLSTRPGQVGKDAC